MVQPGRCGPLPCGPCRLVAACTPSGAPPPGRLGAGLTAQRLLAAGVVGLGPGHSGEARLVALQGWVLALTLHGGALHRHGALVAHAGLAVAVPPLSGLEQTRSGSRRAPGDPPAPGQPGPFSRHLRTSPHDWDTLRPKAPHTSTPTAAQAELATAGRALPLLLLQQGGAGGGQNHSRIWETRLVPRRLEGEEKESRAPGVCSQWPRPQAPGTRPLRPGHPQPLLCLPRGRTPAGRTGWRWAWAAGPGTGMPPAPWLLPTPRHQPPSPQGSVRAPAEGAYGTRSRRCPCGR